MTSVTDLDAFNAADAPGALELLHPVCASAVWARAVVDERPYGSTDELASASDRALAGLDWSEVLVALDAHPRIGERAAGAGREAEWSRQEQAVAVGDVELDAALHEANVAYEQRFGWVFLVCATGLGKREILARLNARLADDPAGEHRVVRDELAAIVRLRLQKLLG